MAKRRTSIYQSELTFFGLTPDYRLKLFDQIHEIVFFGEGGYDWNTIYNMPIWLRNFTFNKIRNFYHEKNKPQDTVKQSIESMKAAGATSKKIAPPTYVTKASKK
jgi:hypothetical protein